MRWLPSASTVLCQSMLSGSSVRRWSTMALPTTAAATANWRSTPRANAGWHPSAITGASNSRLYSPSWAAMSRGPPLDHDTDSSEKP
jgi:hypothetical protein